MLAVSPPTEVLRAGTSPMPRRWVVEVDGAAVGWLAVAVRAGIGTLAGWVPEAVQTEARSLLDHALAADLQVVRLEPAAPAPTRPDEGSR